VGHGTPSESSTLFETREMSLSQGDCLIPGTHYIDEGSFYGRRYSRYSPKLVTREDDC